MERTRHDAVIVEAVRTPIGKRGKTLSQVRADDLAAKILQEVVRRAGIEPGLVEDVIMGCSTPIDEQGANVGRFAVLISGFPVEVPAVTINRMCASSDQAAHYGSQAIEVGDVDIVIAAGIESMSRVPMASDSGRLSPRVLERYRIIPQGNSAELMAQRWDLKRMELDEYSLQSHERALTAQAEGRFDAEIFPIEIPLPDGGTELFEKDEGPRADTSMEFMAGLRPAFQEDGRITAGNSSQMSDGAAAVLLMSREKAEELGLRPRARIVGRVSVGSDPTLQLAGPIAATRRIFERTGLELEDMDVIEVNEAFASVVLAWAREHQPDMSRVNPNGGAIALGHPLGATGARLMTTMLHELERQQGRYGLQTMCIGHGLANATVIERES